MAIWLRDTSAAERRALAAAYGGYGLDGFDFMMYSFVIPTLLSAWQMTKSEAGYITSGALLASAVGGWAAGILADRYGRARILQLTVLWFAVFTFLSGFAHSFGQLFVTRTLQGFGFGGEWAVGSVLVSEMVAPKYRGRAAGLIQSSWSVGWGLAAVAFWVVSALLPQELAWRVVFWLGLLPGAFIIYIRRNVPEPPVYLASRARGGAPFGGKPQTHPVWGIFGSKLLPTTLLATLLSTGMLAAYYSVTNWLPAFLSTERHLSVANTTGYMLMIIVGSLAGYLVSASLTDAMGRRRGFIVFAVCAAALVAMYTSMPLTRSMLLIGFLMGFFVLGIFSGMGAYLSELYPGEVRASGQGFCYSIGRGVGGFCPLLIGLVSDHVPLGKSIAGFTIAAYALVVVSALGLPETKGKNLA
jgi:MFS family permease